MLFLLLAAAEASQPGLLGSHRWQLSAGLLSPQVAPRFNSATPNGGWLFMSASLSHAERFALDSPKSVLLACVVE